MKKTIKAISILALVFQFLYFPIITSHLRKAMAALGTEQGIVAINCFDPMGNNAAIGVAIGACIVKVTETGNYYLKVQVTLPSTCEGKMFSNFYGFEDPFILTLTKDGSAYKEIVASRANGYVVTNDRTQTGYFSISKQDVGCYLFTIRNISNVSKFEANGMYGGDTGTSGSLQISETKIDSSWFNSAPVISLSSPSPNQSFG